MTETERWRIIDAQPCTCPQTDRSFTGDGVRRDHGPDHAYPTCPQYLALELTRAVQNLDEGFTQDARVTLMRMLDRLYK